MEIKSVRSSLNCSTSNISQWYENAVMSFVVEQFFTFASVYYKIHSF